MKEPEARAAAATETLELALTVVDRMTGLLELSMRQQHEVMMTMLGRLGDSRRDATVATFDAASRGLAQEVRDGAGAAVAEVQAAAAAVAAPPVETTPAVPEPALVVAEAPEPVTAPVVAEAPSAPKARTNEEERMVRIWELKAKPPEELVHLITQRLDAYDRAQADDAELARGYALLALEAVAALPVADAAHTLDREQLQRLLKIGQKEKSRALKDVPTREALRIARGERGDGAASRLYETLRVAETQIKEALVLVEAEKPLEIHLDAKRQIPPVRQRKKGQVEMRTEASRKAPDWSKMTPGQLTKRLSEAVASVRAAEAQLEITVPDVLFFHQEPEWRAQIEDGQRTARQLMAEMERRGLNKPPFTARKKSAAPAIPRPIHQTGEIYKPEKTAVSPRTLAEAGWEPDTDAVTWSESTSTPAAEPPPRRVAEIVSSQPLPEGESRDRFLRGLAKMNANGLQQEIVRLQADETRMAASLEPRAGMPTQDAPDQVRTLAQAKWKLEIARRILTERNERPFPADTADAGGSEEDTTDGAIVLRRGARASVHAETAEELPPPNEADRQEFLKRISGMDTVELRQNILRLHEDVKNLETRVRRLRDDRGRSSERVDAVSLHTLLRDERWKLGQAQFYLAGREPQKPPVVPSAKSLERYTPDAALSEYAASVGDEKSAFKPVAPSKVDQPATSLERRYTPDAALSEYAASVGDESAFKPVAPSKVDQQIFRRMLREQSPEDLRLTIGEDASQLRALRVDFSASQDQGLRTELRRQIERLLWQRKEEVRLQDTKQKRASSPKSTFAVPPAGEEITEPRGSAPVRESARPDEQAKPEAA
jgi:hypothetical protein